MRHAKLVCALIIGVWLLTLSVKPAFGWSNGGYSADPLQPDYGTHDWIAQHALDYLPAAEKQFITDNLVSYLYGTELPDNNGPVDGIGDTGKHHIYFYANGTMQDDSSAVRASEEYQKALNYLKDHNYSAAAKEAGIMTHYIADMAVWAHMMGATTAWGSEPSNVHSNYETYVDTRTNNYSDTYNSYLVHDGNIVNLSAYTAAVNLANDSTFDQGGIYTCVWMNNSYSTSNPTYWNRAGESLNLAVNAIADVLHSLYVESGNIIPEVPSLQVLSATMLLSTMVAIIYAKKHKKAALRFDVH
jgi:hypothetical protein